MITILNLVLLKAQTIGQAGDLPKPVVIVSAVELAEMERGQLGKSQDQTASTKDGTVFRKVDRPTYRLLIQETMLPYGYAAGIRRILGRFRDLGDPLASFDPSAEKNSDLLAWISSSANPAALGSAPNVRIASSRTMSLSAGGRTVRMAMDRPIELPNDAFPSSAPTRGSKPPLAKPFVSIPRADRHVYIPPTVRYTTALDFQTDLSTYVASVWKDTLESLRKESADFNGRFESERAGRSTMEDAENGTEFDRLSPRAKAAFENYLDNNWSSLGFSSRDESREWLKKSSVTSTATRLYANFGGFEDGTRTTFHIGLPWP